MESDTTNKSPAPRRINSLQDEGVGADTSFASDHDPTTMDLPTPTTTDCQSHSATTADSGICMEMDRLHRQSLELADDIVARALGRSPAASHSATPTPLKHKLRALVDRMAQKHEIIYKSMARRVTEYNGLKPVKSATKPSNLPTASQQLNAHENQSQSVTSQSRVLSASEAASYRPSCGVVLRGVADEMFADHKYTYGRLVALYTFTAFWVRHLKEEDLFEAYGAENLPSAVADYIVNNAVGTWMLQHNSWDGLLEQFPDGPDWESRVFNGLVLAGVGLGLVAGFLALRPSSL